MGIVFLDVIAAASSLLTVDQAGFIVAFSQFLFFVALAVGMWRLRRWAWIAEVAVSVLQIALLFLGSVVALIASSIHETSPDFPIRQLLALFASLILVNALILVALMTTKVRAVFR